MGKSLNLGFSRLTTIRTVRQSCIYRLYILYSKTSAGTTYVLHNVFYNLLFTGDVGKP